MKVQVASFIVQNQLIKSLVIEKCDKTDDDMDKIMNFFYEESFKDLTRVLFKDSLFETIPFSLHIFFPLLKILDISNCGLKKISAFDLRGLTHLAALILDGNKLTTLPNGLFMHTPNLRSISFSDNELTKIEAKLLEPLTNLKFANFSKNKAIDAIYAVDTESCKSFTNLVSLEKLNKLIAKCNTSILQISVKGRGFNMDRAKIIVHSPAIAEIVAENKEVKVIELSEITVEAFRIVSAFVHDKPLTWDQVEAREVFAAAKKLKIEKLLSLAEEEILSKVNSTTCIEYLLFGNNNKVESVKDKAFEMIKKEFPENSLPDRLKNEPENLMKLVQAKSELDDLTMKARQKFNNVFNQVLE